MNSPKGFGVIQGDSLFQIMAVNIRKTSNFGGASFEFRQCSSERVGDFISGIVAGGKGLIVGVFIHSHDFSHFLLGN